MKRKGDDHGSITKKICGAATYRTKYQKHWQEKWPFVQPVKENLHAFHCTTCSKNVSSGHQGEADIVRHSESQQHKANASILKANTKLNFKATSQALKDKVTRAETKVTNLLVQHNVPLAVADHLSPLIRDIFNDSEIAKAYASASTKTTCILNESLAPHFKSALVNTMKEHPFSIAIDGSNDTGLEKLNPLTVRFFDTASGKIVTQLLDMCLTKGTNSGTAESIFNKMDEVFMANSISWDNCIGTGVDNTSVNVGIRNSIKTRVLKKNSAIYFMGCPCHIVHNMASKASQSFLKETNFDVEEMMIDIYFYFDKSTKRKSGLADYCVFCDTQYRQIIKHVSTRWLSLEKTVDRTLRQYPGLKSYFLSESDSNTRFKRLQTLYTNPITECYLRFYQAALQPFINFNLFLQQEHPIIAVLHSQLQKFMQNLYGKFIRVQVIKDAKNDMKAVNYEHANQLPDGSIHIGYTTRTKIHKYLDEGDISDSQVKTFYKAVRSFYEKAVQYAIKNLPLDDEVLRNAEFVNFEAREAAAFVQVEYFIKRFSTILSFESPTEISFLAEEFTSYQLLERDDIPEYVWKSASVCDDSQTRHYRMDAIWSYIKSMRNPDGTLQFQRLSRVALLVLVLPHSNAEEERVFSLVTKNNTSFRPSLKLDGTLSSIITLKLANPEPCVKFEPTKEVLKTAKTATMKYNLQTSSK